MTLSISELEHSPRVHVPCRMEDVNHENVNRVESSDEDDEQEAAPLQDEVLDEHEGPANVNEGVLGEDADTRFWLMVIRWLVRGRFGYIELAELMTFLFASNVDLASITLRSIPVFKRFDQRKQESRSRGRWKCAEVGGDLKIAFRYRAGNEAVAAL